MSSASWFVGRMNKGACEEMITAAATGGGTYCVRQSETTDKMFLVINDAGAATTFSLEPSGGGYKLGSDAFPSLDEVVLFMKKRALPAKKGGALMLKYPFDKATAGAAAAGGGILLRATKSARRPPSDTDKAKLMAAARSKSTRSGRPPNTAETAALAVQGGAGRRPSRAPSEADRMKLMQAAMGGKGGGGLLMEDDGEDDSEHTSIKRVISTDGSEVNHGGGGNQDLAVYIAPLDTDAYDQLSTHPTFHVQLPPYFKGKTKNRYWDILPNPTTRVPLRPLPIPGTKRADPASIYINANYVRGYGDSKAKEYIASQAPLPSTVYQFIRMIWEQKVGHIVMVTGLIEAGKRKCERYWPEESGKPLRFECPGGPTLFVILTKIEEMPSVKVSHLKITDGKKFRKVQHYWYHTWPDHGVPTNVRDEVFPNDVLGLLTRVKGDRRGPTGDGDARGPLLVHCSAGVGRTGTFIVIDHVMDAIKQGNKVDLVELIHLIREDRMTMVQHTVQYKFAYQACINYAQSHISTEDGGEIYALASGFATEDDHVSGITKSNRASISRGSTKAPWQPKKVGGNEVFALSGGMALTQTAADAAATKAEGIDAESGASVPPSPTAAELPLEQQSWYRSQFSRSQVADMFKGSPAGTFIIRKSSHEGSFVLSVRAPSGTVLNARLIPTIVDGVTNFRLGESGHQIYPSIVGLVGLFVKEAHLVDKHDGAKFCLFSETAEASADTPTPSAPESIYGSVAESTNSEVKAEKPSKENDYAVPVPLGESEDDDSDGDDSDIEGEVSF